MINSTLVLTGALVYFLILFLVAIFTEKQKRSGHTLTSNSVIYVLTLGIYATTWTFYGSIGSAANSSFLFLAIYIGPTLMMIAVYAMLKRLIRIKNEYGITNIAGYLSSRYGKSHGIGAVATLIALIGGAPYFALQIKAVVSSYAFITLGTQNAVPKHIDLLILLTIIIFTIFFGFRRLNPDETHSGLMMVVAIQSAVKLIALLGAGICTVYFVFHGFGDLLNAIRQNAELLTKIHETRPSYSAFLSNFLLSMGAIILLPHMFHVMVVENTSEKHLRGSLWGLPVYLILITIFTFPIAMAGMLLTKDVSLADLFTLIVPAIAGQTWLTLLIFIGGLSAAFSMITVSTITITTMVTNNIVMPILNSIPWLSWTHRFILQIRWITVIGILGVAYLFVLFIGDTYILVKIGIISFAAAFQFGPTLIGGLFWRQGSRIGALVGLWVGFAVWMYTSLIPAFVRSGWIRQTLLDNGPFGIGFLRPEYLFGITQFDPLTITVFFSILLNAGAYIFCSYLFPNNKTEQEIADSFVRILKKDILDKNEKATINIAEKKRLIQKIFTTYLNADQAPEQTEECLHELHLDTVEKITLGQLTRINRLVEKKLTSFVGAPTANSILSKNSLFSDSESAQLSTMYAKIVADLKITPEEFTQKINYFLDREKILTDASKELEEKVQMRTAELEKTNRQLQDFNKLMIGRELKMIELKKEIEALRNKS